LSAPPPPPPPPAPPTCTHARTHARNRTQRLHSSLASDALLAALLTGVQRQATVPRRSIGLIVHRTIESQCSRWDGLLNHTHHLPQRAHNGWIVRSYERWAPLRNGAPHANGTRHLTVSAPVHSLSSRCRQVADESPKGETYRRYSRTIAARTDTEGQRWPSVPCADRLCTTWPLYSCHIARIFHVYIHPHARWGTP
jgi:hypothetical protein